MSIVTHAQLNTYIDRYEKLYEHLLQKKFSFRILRVGGGVLAWELCADQHAYPRLALAVVNTIFPSRHLPMLEEDEWNTMQILTDHSLELWKKHMFTLQVTFPDAVLEEFFYLYDDEEEEEEQKTAVSWGRFFGLDD